MPAAALSTNRLLQFIRCIHGHLSRLNHMYPRQVRLHSRTATHIDQDRPKGEYMRTKGRISP